VSHRTHQASTAQQRISSFLSPADSLGLGAIPERFLEFCQRSTEAVHGTPLYMEPFAQPDLGNMEFDDAEDSLLNVNRLDQGQLVPLQPIPSTRQVIAIDTSTIKLGELDDGSLCALRGATVLLDKKQYKYVKYGPLVFSIGNNSYDALQRFAELGSITQFPGAPNVDGLLKRIRNAFERWIQLTVSSSIMNGFVLIDGSLIAGTPDNPTKELERILEIARRNRNVVIAISKKTKLRIRDQSITNLVEPTTEPCLFDVDREITQQFPAYPVRFLGRVFVGKLAKSAFTFRIDVDRQIPIHETPKEICQLMGTDIVDQGYPETLRLAHIMATFTAGDVLAMQAFAAARYGVQLIPKLALRRSLFGPFGTAWEEWH
jgi:hypothetical protein